MTSSTPSRRHLGVGAEQDLLVRFAGADDRARLDRLAALDSTLPLRGRVLLAELDGVVVAALSLTTGRVVADPFTPTAGLVRVLRARADGQERAGARRRAKRLLTPARLRTA